MPAIQEKSPLSIHLKKGLEENLKGRKSQVFQGRASTPSYAQKKATVTSHWLPMMQKGQINIPITSPPSPRLLIKRKEKNKI